MTDSELVLASRRGETAAFGALIERYQGVVCAVTYSRTGDRSLSEDVAQETFLAAWRQLDRLRDAVKLRSWLCGIARNLARKARRRSDRETGLEGELVATGTPFTAVADAEAERVVREALARVPVTYREVLVLFYAEGLTTREIADALELSDAAVQQRLSRGRQHLADGVNDLVERALRGAARRRNLVAAVLAALPVLPSPAEASTGSSSGGHMLKLALAAAVGLTAAGTTAYVATRGTDAAPTAVGATPTAVAQAPVVTGGPIAVRPAAVPPIYPTQPPALPGVAPNDPPAPQEPPRVERQKLAQLGFDRGPSRGPADAPVTIVMFTDAKCVYCGKVLGTIDEVWDEFPGKLRLVVKQFPVHTEAVLAAEAALAADAQGKYWELHAQIFANPDDLSRDALVEHARQAGLDVTTFARALDTHAYAAALAADQQAAKDIDVSGTPSFLINGKHFVGARPAADLRAEIAAALSE
ncbi:MAG: sigma-70 family RNA polymerase sigma factor [Myxococcales bacterium]|nr:sigma-70 family RNA polymerase sigma factor [Myxococcales bacterium]